MPKPDMSLGVTVQISGNIDNQGVMHATPTYSEESSTPPSGNVVTSGGDINLNNMADPGNNYSKKTDITFSLSGNVTDQNGNSCPVQFPSDVAQAVTISKQGGGGNGELTPSLNSANELVIDDADDDGATYTYCLNIQAQTANGTFSCSLDPNIVNR